MDEKTQRISLRAYELWENEGRPHGRDAAHWAEAEEQIMAELNGLPVPAEAATAPASPAAASGPAKAPAGDTRPAAAKAARSGKSRR